MNIYNRMKVAVYIAAGLMVGIAESAIADEKIKITIEELTVDDSVYSPFYEVETTLEHQQGAAQKWIKLGIYFKTEGGWIDELEVTQMAVFKPGDDNRVYLSEKVKYINLEPGDHYAYVYLHPSYVKRYEIDDFDVDSAAVIAVNGEVMASKETNRKMEKNWSKDETRQYKGYLLNHAETPFWFINYDFKEIIKHKNQPTE